MTEQLLAQNTAPVSNAPVEATAPVANTTAPSFDINSFFPEDIRKDPDFERYSKNLPKDLESIAKDYYHKNKHFGKARDVVKAELEAEYNKPVEYKPEDYSYELPEGYEIENEILDVAKNKARELGIKPELAKQFVKELFTADAQISAKLAEEAKAQEKAQYEAEKTIIEGLKKEWGFEFDNNLKLADATLSKLTTPEEYNKIVSLPKDVQATITKLFHKIGSRMSEGSIGNTKTGMPMTESDFLAKREAIRNSNKMDSVKLREEAELYQSYYGN